MSPVAEVIASSTRAFEAEVYREVEPPAFGSWVEVRPRNGTALYGLVSHVEIGSMEPHRRARAYGLDEDELRRERPQIPGLHFTLMRAQLLAYRDRSGRLRQTLPPHPAGIHDAVYPCEACVVKEINAPFDFLRTLARNPDPEVPVDELLVAALLRIAEAQESPREADDALVEAGRALSRLLNDDHERLHSILRRAS